MLFSLPSAFTILAVCLLRVVAGPASSSNAAPPRGFVTARGTKFELDGKPFVSGPSLLCIVTRET